jgi:hypothetical protein
MKLATRGAGIAASQSISEMRRRQYESSRDDSSWAMGILGGSCGRNWSGDIFSIESTMDSGAAPIGRRQKGIARWFFSFGHHAGLHWFQGRL